MAVLSETAPFTEKQWALSCILHQEGQRCQRSQVQDVRQQQRFLAHLKDGFDFTSWGRCWEVSCFCWPIRDVSCLPSSASLAPLIPFAWGFHRQRAGEGERYEMVTGEEWSERKRERESVLVHSPEHTPQTQVVNVMQLTRLWYKLINDRQLAQRGKRERKVNP